MKKRLLTVLLAVILVMALGTIAAFADDMTVVTADQLMSAIENAQDGDTITLGGDIKLDFSEEILDVANYGYLVPLIDIYNDITIDLNGKSITWNYENSGSLPTTPAMFSINGANVVLTGDGTIDVEAGNNGSYGIDIINGGSLIIESGTYTGATSAVQVSDGQLKIYGGTFKQAATIASIDPDYAKYVINCYDSAYKTGDAEIAVYGGTFVGFDPADDPEGEGTSYVPSGIIATTTTDAVTYRPEADVSTGVAEVNGIYFDSLGKALDAALNGDTVTLLKDINVSGYILINKNVTIDLGGNCVTGTGPYVFASTSGAWALRNGSVVSAYEGTDLGITVFVQSGEANIDNVDITAPEGCYGIMIGSGYNYDNTNYDSSYSGSVVIGGGSTIDSEDTGIVVVGRQTITGRLVVNNAEITAKYYAICGNGSNDNTQITINRGTITSEEANAIFHPQGGTLNITGGVITGVSGVQFCGYGTLNISGDVEIRATGDFCEHPTKSADQTDGSVNDGAALSIVSRGPGYQNDDNQNMIVNISGGTFISDHNEAVRVYRFQRVNDNWVSNENTSLESRIQSLNVDGGIFVSGGQDGDFEIDREAENAILVSDGNFSAPMNRDYLAEGLNAELYSGNSQTPYSYYESVDDALAAAQPGDVVTDLTNVSSNVMCEVRVDYYGNGSYETLSVRSGSSITPVVPTRSGYRFAGWRDTQGNRYEAGQAITVYSDMTLTAMWNAVNVPDTTYPITIADTDNGTVSTNLTNASAGATITITAEPDEGYSVGRVVVTGPDGRLDVTRVNATTYTFKMPEGDVEVEVEFVSGKEALPFTDVTAGAWYYDAVSYVYFNGMMEGDSATTFNPDGTMTRAMFWAVLGRIDGASITGSNWAEAAREWAVTNGVSDGENASGLVTREQMVTMLWRYAGEPESSYSLSAYSDAASVSDWAEEAMSWALENGIVEGMTATTLEPQSTATRAQCATIFMRYDALEA